jgi:voltage-gated potassium channel Kch
MGGRAAGAIRRLGRWLTRWLAFLLTIDVRLLVACLAVVSFGLGYYGLWQFVHHQTAPAAYGDSWDDVLFYDLQLYTFAAAPAAGVGPFSVWLEIARFLAPLGALLAVLAALRLVLAEQIRRYLTVHASGHAIVAGDGAVALTLARNLGRGTSGREGEGRKVVLVGTSDDTLTQARRYDILTVRGQPSDRATLGAAGVARADQMYACASDDSVNVDSAVLAGQLAEGRERPLLAYALVPGAMLGGDLRALRIGASGETGQRLDFFTLEDCAARKLIADYPLTGDAAHPPQAVIIGFGPLGQAVLREIARGQLARHGGSRVEVFVRNATALEVAATVAAFPPIGYACTIWWDETLELPGAGAYTVFLCLDDDDDDDDTLRESMAVGRAVASGRGYVVACVRESASFARTLAGYTRILEDLRGKIRVFGIIEEACMPANIRDDAFIEQLARAIHEDYLARSRAKGETNTSAVPWGELPDDLRQANIAQAVGIGAKLAVINAVVAPESPTAPEFRFTDREVEELAEQEHERWMRERIAQGWRHGGKRNNRRKIHPDLVDWTALPESERQKDRDAVLAIPGILRDAGYQILRLPADS